jgi:hypothetical protein
MNRLVDPTRLTTLHRSLPARVEAAARAVLEAQSRLGQILAWRAAGLTIKRSDLAVARMALMRAERDAEDLQRISAVLPGMMKGNEIVRLVQAATADVGD